MVVVTFPACSWDKRFFQSVSSAQTITDKESAQLWRIFARYRRQMSFPSKARLLKLAETLAAPDLRKVEDARRKQAEIDALKSKYSESIKT